MASRTIDLLRDLVAIDSVNPTLVPGARGEQEIAEAIAQVLRRARIDSELQPVLPGRPNVVGSLEGRRPGPTLVLCGHIDTVGVSGMAAPFDPVVRDNRVYGRGAQDMKGGLAACIAAMVSLAEDGGIEAGRVMLAGVVDEEDASRGAELFVSRWKGDAAVVAEPTAMKVGIAHKGFAWIELRTTGRAAHGSLPAVGRDAILRMGRVLARLDVHDRALRARAGHSLLGPPSLHASTISGGREWSTYPDTCILRLERRTVPGESADEPLLEITRMLEPLVAEDETFLASARQVFARRPYEIAAGHDLVRGLQRAASAAGVEAELTGVSFWADSSVFGEAGTPAVLFGPRGAGLHGIEEYVEVDDVLTCERAFIELARSLCV